MRRFLIVIVLLAIVGGGLYGLSKWIMYDKAKASIEDLRVKISADADLSYQDLTTSLQGAVDVIGVTLTPRDSKQPIYIDRVKLSAPPEYFIFEADEQQPKPPESLGLSLVGITVPIDSAALKNLDVPGLNAPIDQTESDACERLGNNLFEPEVLQAMGLNELEVDITFSYGINKSEKTLLMDFNIDVRDVQSINTYLRITDFDPEILENGGLASLGMAAATGSSGAMPANTNFEMPDSLPSLGGFEVATTINPEFGKRLVDVCAKRLKSTPKAFSAQLHKQFLQELAGQGLLLGPGLKFASQIFFERWGEIRATSEPDSPIGLFSLAALNGQNYKKILDLDVVIAERLVTDLSYTYDQKLATSHARPGQKNSNDSKKRRAVYRFRYKPVSVAELKQHIGREVRLELPDQPTREGILAKIDGNVAEVVQRRRGGKFSAHVPLKEISQAEVKFKVKVN